MLFNPMDLSGDGSVDFTDYMLFNTYINPTSGGALVSKVARYLADSPNDTIEEAEFRSACYACSVDPDSFTAEDFEQLKRELSELP